MEQYRRADLHVHSTASDGTLLPQQVVEEAARVGLAAVGIADHDAISGISPAMEAAQPLGLIVVPAVEINTDFGKDEIHMLGYYIDPDSESLNSELDRLRTQRATRAMKMVERLAELGMPIDFPRIAESAGEGAIGRPHIARAMVEAGYVRSMNSAFGKYLVRGAPAYVPRYKLTPFQAMDIIRDAGGVPVLAHPGINHHDEMIPKLVEAGLQGLEVYHSDHSAAQSRHYLKVAERYNLVPTGGSDSHGPNNVKTIPIGNVTVDIEIVYRLQALAEERKAATPG